MTIFTREVSPLIGECELTHVPWRPVDVDLARRQHSAYEDALRAAGADVRRLEPTPHLPDGVFVEDTAIVLPDLAIILRPGAASRRRETESVATVLTRYRELRRIRSPGTVDGGDVLLLGETLFVGMSTRTNADGVRQLRRIVGDIGYNVVPLEVHGCLHLKSAVTKVGPDLLLANRQWFGDVDFGETEVLEVDPSEPAAANALWAQGVVIYPASFPATARRLRDRGVPLVTIDVSEIQKAEGGVTCCCLPVEE